MKHINLDVIDLRILAELQADGALSNVALARRVHLSPSPCLMRVKALEAGVVWVNCFGDGDMTQPFGGYKQSGNTRDKSMECLAGYMQYKAAWLSLG